MTCFWNVLTYNINIGIDEDRSVLIGSFALIYGSVAPFHVYQGECAVVHFASGVRIYVFPKNTHSMSDNPPFKGKKIYNHLTQFP